MDDKPLLIDGEAPLTDDQRRFLEFAKAVGPLPTGIMMATSGIESPTEAKRRQARNRRKAKKQARSVRKLQAKEAKISGRQKVKLRKLLQRTEKLHQIAEPK